MRKIIYWQIVLAILLVSVSDFQAKDNSRYVNPFIGVDRDGQTFPGASLPFGLVKIGPDCGEKATTSGYQSGQPIHGFSHVHLSGTGGGPKYGNILFMPLNSGLGKYPSGLESRREYASPGYYRVTLLDENEIDVELTVSHRTGFHRYTFSGTGERSVVIDVSSILGLNHCCGENQTFLDGKINVESDSTVSGFCTAKGGWNQGGEYSVFFYAAFDTSFRPSSDTEPYKTQLIFGSRGTRTVQARVGISFLSREKARENLYSEIPHWDFEAVRRAAVDSWNDILDRVEIDTKFNAERINFYSSLYRCYLMPNDRTGEYAKISGTYFDDYYAIWDTYRTADPLRLLLTPSRQTKILQSLINIYKAEGYAPDARSGNSNGRTQGGSNSDILFAEAYIKGLDGLDYETVLESMLKNSETPPTDPQKEGRGGLADYRKLGYVTSSDERSGTRTVEYAYCDYAIAVLAEKLGKDKLAEQYYKMSHNWENLWRDATVDGISGFIWPRDKNGAWVTDSSFLSKYGTWPDYFYEGTTWEFSLFAPHDMTRLIEKCGGPGKFIDRVDHLFDKGYFNVANEPSFLASMLYHWAGRPDKSAERVNHILKVYYHPTKDGLPGNDDSGAMAAWYVFNTMGLYPLAATDIYLITSPLNEHTLLNLENGSSFEIVAEDLNEDNIYVQSATLNGDEYVKTWLTHKDITAGGKLVLKMGAKPSSWGREQILH